jgi:ribosomal protein L11 methyltransferase
VRVAGLWIGPPWESTEEPESAVVVDPGRAFGTGAHPTTRACIELLARLERGRLLDAGCGSGVVAVAASRLGYAPVLALDADPVAVEVARATVHRNDVGVEVRRADVLVDEIGEADVLVANIELEVVDALLRRRSAPTVVTSGYLARDAPRTAGWARVSRLELEGWAADVLIAK